MVESMGPLPCSDPCLLLRARTVPVPSVPHVPALRGPCGRGFPTNPRDRESARSGELECTRCVSRFLSRPRCRGQELLGANANAASSSPTGAVSLRSPCRLSCGVPSSRIQVDMLAWRSLGDSRPDPRRCPRPEPRWARDANGMEGWLLIPASRQRVRTGVPVAPRMTPGWERRRSVARLSPEGPVALRPSLATGLPLSCHRRERGTIPSKSQKANRGVNSSGS